MKDNSIFSRFRLIAFSAFFGIVGVPIYAWSVFCFLGGPCGSIGERDSILIGAIFATFGSGCFLACIHFVKKSRAEIFSMCCHYGISLIVGLSGALYLLIPTLLFINRSFINDYKHYRIIIVFITLSVVCCWSSYKLASNGRRIFINSWHKDRPTPA